MVGFAYQGLEMKQSFLEWLMSKWQEGARAPRPQEYNPQTYKVDQGYRGNPTTPPTYSDTPSMFPNSQRAGDLSPPINNMNRAINRGTPTQLESMMNDPEGNEWLSKLPKSLLQQLFSDNLSTILNNTQFRRAVQVNNRYIDESKYLGQDWKTSPDWDMTGRKM